MQSNAGTALRLLKHAVLVVVYLSLLGAAAAQEHRPCGSIFRAGITGDVDD